MAKKKNFLAINSTEFARRENFRAGSGVKNAIILTMSSETQPIRIETGEEVAFELMKFIAEKENRELASDEVRDYYLDLFVECAAVVYDGERAA